MQKVEIIPPADFQVNISTKGQNQTLLLEFMTTNSLTYNFGQCAQIGVRFGPFFSSALTRIYEFPPIFLNLIFLLSVLRERRSEKADMQKVEILPPADFQVKISAKGQNQTLLLGLMNFRQFS